MIRRTFIAAATAAAIAVPFAAGAQTADKDIVATAQEAGSFSTLLAAAEAAGLVETLTGEGPYTVFAPTDDAFAALPEGTVDTLLMPENKDKLTSILTYHVVPGAVMSSDLTDGMTAASVEGQELTFKVGDSVMVDEATVTQPDIEASNGVIHVIDSVLMPDSAM